MLYLAIGPEMTGSSCYPNGLDQATSDKLQAASSKHQASSKKRLDSLSYP